MTIFKILVCIKCEKFPGDVRKSDLLDEVCAIEFVVYEGVSLLVTLLTARV